MVSSQGRNNLMKHSNQKTINNLAKFLEFEGWMVRWANSQAWGGVDI